jgi:plastocyanin
MLKGLRVGRITVIFGKRILAVHLACAGALVGVAACGGSSPSSPSGGGGGGSVVVKSTGSVAAAGATITIGANSAVSPSQVTIAVGQSVTFVNSDSRSHDMESDPHPAHTSCPSIANVGLLQPGQSKTTFGFGNSGSCGYHDHNDSTNTALMGRIVVQ